MKRMPDSLSSMILVIEQHISRGEIDLSRNLAESWIQEDPEDFSGYILMAYHYGMLGQKEDAYEWVNEALRRAPADDYALMHVINILHNLLSYGQECLELIETGMRIYPENPFYHSMYAKHIHSTDLDAALASSREAVRLKPYDDAYLGDYAIYLYIARKFEEAEKYEQLALQENPENINNLVNFAWMAYQLRKFKKAQILINEAMRLQPESEFVRRYYEKILPSENGLIRMLLKLNQAISPAWSYPARFIWKHLYKDKKKPGYWVFLIMLAELALLYAIAGKHIFWGIIILYMTLLFTCLKINNSMLKEAGLTAKEETNLKKRARTAQKSAMKEMKRTVSTKTEQQEPSEPKLSPYELEAQLAAIWSSENIGKIKELAETKGAEEPQAPPQPEKERQLTAWPKEHTKRPAYLLIAALALLLAIRVLPALQEDEASIPAETQESVAAFMEEQEQEEDLAIINEARPVVDLLLKNIQDDRLLENIADIASNSYEPVMVIKLNNPLLKELADAKIEKALKLDLIVPVSYFLLVHEKDQVAHKTIIEVKAGQISYIYADKWNDTEKEKEEYERLLQRIEKNGFGID